MTINAVIDIGTNTTRLLIRDTNDIKKDISRIVRITKLGAELEKSGKLGEFGMQETTKTIKEYIDISRSFGVGTDSIYIFATAACRNADNGQDFINKLEQQTQCKTQIISGEMEGKLSFLGAVSGIKQNNLSKVVFDIGGGSTEFAVSDEHNNEVCESVVSIPIGSVRITKRHLDSDPPTPEELSNALGEIKEYLKDVESQISRIRDSDLWIGVAATTTTVAAVEIGQKEFDANQLHEMVLTKENVEDVFRTLATESHQDRIYNPGLEKERADVIVGGVAILVSVMRYFELSEITVSCTDLLDGLFSYIAN